MTQSWYEEAQQEIYRYYFDRFECQDSIDYRSDLDKIRQDKLLFLAEFSQFIPSDIIEYREIGNYVAKNINTPPNILERLADSKYASVRQAVARNPNTLLSVLAKLSEDEDIGVRSNVAANKNTSGWLLERLANDEDIGVRRHVALNTSIPASVLDKLVADKVNPIRASLARNSSVPTAILKQLSGDSAVTVRRNAKTNLKRSFNKSSKNNIVTEDFPTPEEYYEIDEKDKIRFEREYLTICDVSSIKDTNPPAAILEKIAEKALQEIAIAYGTSDDSLVREHTATFITVINSSKFETNFKEIIFRQFYELGSFFTLVLLLSEYADSSTLAEYSSSEFWLYRYAITRNSHTPDRILELLIQDNNRIVKAAAEDIVVR